VKILVLASKHVRELLTYRECADVMREALAGLARGQIQQPLRTVVRPREAVGFMGLMPAYSPEAGYGLKALVITPGNPAIGKDAHQGGVLLSDVQTGEPLALINASAITEVRTAAVSAVATDLLARPEAAELAVIGTGVQGRAHAHANSRRLRGKFRHSSSIGLGSVHTSHCSAFSTIPPQRSNSSIALESCWLGRSNCSEPARMSRSDL